MNPFKWLFPLFRGRSTPVPPKDTPPSAVLAKPEPSCLAKGTAELLKKGEGWKVSERKSFAGYWRVRLNHPQLGIEIQLIEYVSPLSIVLELVRVNNECKIAGWGRSNPDTGLILETLLAHPYPALKKRLDKKAKDNLIRESQIKAIESLGCPPILDS